MGELTNAKGGFVIFLARFDGDGNHKWSKGFGGDGGDYSYSVPVDTNGNVYGTGYFGSSSINFGGCTFNSAGGGDIYIFKYAP
ncbi:MAG: hypothetical protein ACP5QK_08280 [Myxococcota bacterium]